MATRLDLQQDIEKLFKTKNVYYQPPEGFKLSYPCVVYTLDYVNTRRADDMAYNNAFRYQLTYMSTKADLDVITKVLDHFKMCSFDRPMKIDGLYHYFFNLYY